MQDSSTKTYCRIKEIYDCLKSQEDLSPHNNVVNALLSELVSTATSDEPDQEESLNLLKSDGLDKEIRRISEKAEHELEMYYATILSI